MIKIRNHEYVCTITMKTTDFSSTNSSDNKYRNKDISVWTTGYFEFEDENGNPVEIDRETVRSISTKFFSFGKIDSCDVKKRVIILEQEYRSLNDVKFQINREISNDLEEVLKMLNK